MNKERRLVFAIPGDIATLSGGYGYDRHVIAELGALGWSVEHMALPFGFPDPSKEELAETSARFSAVADDSLVLIDGLAFGAMPQIAAAEAGRLRLVALVHHPLALETGLSREKAARLGASEKAALNAARRIVVTSPETARALNSDFDIAEAMIHIAVPGTETAAPARGSVDHDTPGVATILSVGSLTPRKDHGLLVSSLEKLADRSWQCRIVGASTVDLGEADRLRQQIATAGLDGRVTLTGALRDLDAEYDRADIFALASRYEGYGMAFAEALARGLPIVGCRGGAVGDVVPDRAGILVAPGDLAAFTDALALLLDNPEHRQRLAAGSRDAGQRLPDWPTTVGTLSAFLENVR